MLARAPVWRMERDRPSYTAAFVAMFRTMGAQLPAGAEIAHDEFGARFIANDAIERVARSTWLRPFIRRGPLADAVLYMQVRTRAIDDALTAFVAGGGRQVVILGAGYDCRALRFEDTLRKVQVFEVDHPNTQSHKHRVLARIPGNVTSLAWDFESRPISALPDALAERGHDRTQPTLTIWEGVTMYLTPRAIEGSVAAVRDYSSAGSVFVVSYFDRDRLIDRPNLAGRVLRGFVARIGEPMIFGWDPKEIGDWFAVRGFTMASNRAEWENAARLFPAGFGAHVPDRGRYVAEFVVR